ncbi:tetratricopeptide repeat protein [Candidatus Omnitrophota bacterium]
MNVRSYAVFFLIGAIYIVLRLTVLNFSSLADFSLSSVPLFQRFLTFVYVVNLYVGLLIAPVNLHMSRAVEPLTTFFDIRAISSLCAIILITLGAIYSYKRNKLLFFAIIWFFLYLIPQSGLYPINAFMAEHFLYVPSIGFFIVLVMFLRKVFPKRVFVCALSAIVIFYSCVTIRQNATWKEPFSFYKRILVFSSKSAIVHNNLGTLYESRGDLDQALQEYKTAHNLKRDKVLYQANIAQLYQTMNKNDVALALYEELLRLRPEAVNASTYNNFGALLIAMGDYEKAVDSFDAALRLNPSLKHAHFNLAGIYIAQKDYEKSRKEFYKAVGFDISRTNNGSSFPPQEEYLKAFNLKASAKIIYSSLGVLHAHYRLFGLARQCFVNAIELYPHDADVYYNLGVLYDQFGRYKEAQRQWGKTLEFDPQHKLAKQRLLELRNK